MHGVVAGSVVLIKVALAVFLSWRSGRAAWSRLTAAPREHPNTTMLRVASYWPGLRRVARVVGYGWVTWWTIGPLLLGGVWQQLLGSIVGALAMCLLAPIATVVCVVCGWFTGEVMNVAIDFGDVWMRRTLDAQPLAGAAEQKVSDTSQQTTPLSQNPGGV